MTEEQAKKMVAKQILTEAELMQEELEGLSGSGGLGLAASNVASIHADNAGGLCGDTNANELVEQELSGLSGGGTRPDSFSAPAPYLK